MSATDTTCQKCGSRITSAEKGTLFISNNAVAKRGREYVEWRASLDDPKMLTSEELARRPELVPWQVWCDRCYKSWEAVHGDNYWIGLDRISMPADALVWTLHLVEKDWFIGQTNWRAAIEHLFPSLQWDI